MGRMIDADKLIDDLSDLKRSPWANTPYASDERKLGIREALDMIQSIVRVDSQTVDAVPVRHGKWFIGTVPYFVCSECKNRTPLRWDERLGYVLDYRSPYCPNCGAKMDAE